MKAAIAAGTFHSDKITTITINLQQATGTEATYWQQDEISIDNKMYDVVSAHKQQGKVVIKCICDENENLLINTYKKAVEKTQNNSTSKNGVNHKTIFSPFTNGNFSIAVLPIEEGVAPTLIEHQTTFTKAQFSGVLTPPPRQA